MSDNSKYILVIGALLITAAYIVLYTPVADMIFGIQKPEYSPAPIRPMPAPPAPSPPPAEERAIREEIVIPEPPTVFKTLRDPFGVDFRYEIVVAVAPEAKPEVKQEEKKIFVLQGIFRFADGRYYALIDDRIVTEGTRIHNMVVDKIQSDRVVLRRGRQYKTIRIQLGG